MKRIYCYRCPECNTIHDVAHTMAELKDDHLCPNCGTVMKRKYTRVRINMKSGPRGMEIYTNEADATEQMYSMIEESYDEGDLSV